MAVSIELFDAEHAAAALQMMLDKGIDQIGKPLSVSIAGRTVGYGSAAEALMAMNTFIKAQRELLELSVTQAPWQMNQVIRG